MSTVGGCIKLGSAVRPLAYHHPLQVAIEANACDNLTDGRYQLQGKGLALKQAPVQLPHPPRSSTRGIDRDVCTRWSRASARRDRRGSVALRAATAPRGEAISLET